MRITRTAHILFIALITVVVFSGSLKSSFVWDDKFLVVNNPYVKSWHYIPQIFTSQLYEGGQMESNFYRPLQLLSFAADYWLWNLRPFGYHLSSLLFHIINVSLVYLILITVSSSSTLAFFSALFFAISPVISSTTYYISARSDLLMALFLFSSFLLFSRYLRHNSTWLYVFSVSSFILSLASKEMAIILPVLLMLEAWRAGKRLKENIRLILPYFIVTLAYIIARVSLLNFNPGNEIVKQGFTAAIPLWRRLLTDSMVIVEYLKLLLFPYGLHMERFVRPAETIFQFDVIFSISVLAIILFTLKRVSGKDRLILFGALWFLSALLPVLNIYPISSVFIGEGWLYVPSVGFFIAAGVISTRLIYPKIGKAAAFILVASLACYYALFNMAHGRVWRDSVSLFKNVLKYEEKSPFIHLTYNNLGMAYYDTGDIDGSVESYTKSISLSPGYPEAYNNLGVTYMAMGRHVRAIAYFKKAASLNRGYASAYLNLAHAYNSMGFRDKAMRLSAAVIDMDDDSYGAYCSLGYIFSEDEDIDNAIVFFRKACDMREESYEPHYCLGSLYIKKNRFKEALGEYEKALALGLRDSRFYNELAFLYLKNNRFKEAEASLRQSIRLDDSQSEPHNNLGNLYSMFGCFQLAVEEYRKALEIDPENEGIRDNLKKTEKEWKDAA